MRYKKRKINGKTLYAHRVVMAEHVGRELSRDEIVHHRDGDPLNNEISNLEITSTIEHSRHHMLVHQVNKQCVICSAWFHPLPSHRNRDRSCSWLCRGVLISVVSLRGNALNIQAIRSMARIASLRAVGRKFGLSHNSVGTIAAWSDSIARMAVDAVTRGLR